MSGRPRCIEPAHIARRHGAVFGYCMVRTKQTDTSTAGTTDFCPVRIRSALGRHVRCPVFENSAVGASFSRKIVVVRDPTEAHREIVARCKVKE